MKKKFFLNPADTLGVCAPSARFDIGKLNQGICVLKEMGFKVKVPDEIFEKKRYLAGDDILRANVINQLFSDPGIDAIICARGGFGAMRVLEHLNWNIIKQNAKPFIGYSDNTALLLSIINNTGSLVIHAPNVVCLATAQKKTIESLYNTVQGSFNKIHATKAKVIQSGKATGILKGGNIATISHLLGTQFQPDFKNSVLFLEDTGEPAYKIDRMLTQMKMAGLFDHIRGVITGSFETCENGEYMEEILSEIFGKHDIPVLSGLDSGHGKVNLSLCMGCDIIMETHPAALFWV